MFGDNTVGPWEAGRCMPISIRSYSANTYALSKVWFKCSSINLRMQDINMINGQVKFWLYQDCPEKPSALILYRQSDQGGPGLLSVKVMALALLIRTFLEFLFTPVLYTVCTIKSSTAIMFWGRLLCQTQDFRHTMIRSSSG